MREFFTFSKLPLGALNVLKLCANKECLPVSHAASPTKYNPNLTSGPRQIGNSHVNVELVVLFVFLSKFLADAASSTPVHSCISYNYREGPSVVLT